MSVLLCVKRRKREDEHSNVYRFVKQVFWKWWLLLLHAYIFNEFSAERKKERDSKGEVNFVLFFKISYRTSMVCSTFCSFVSSFLDSSHLVRISVYTEFDSAFFECTLYTHIHIHLFWCHYLTCFFFMKIYVTNTKNGCSSACSDSC